MAAESPDSRRESSLQPCLDQIVEQEQKLVELRRAKGPSDRIVRDLMTKIRESYVNIILETPPSSESIEQQLWLLHHSFIQDFRKRLEKRKAAAVAEADVPNKKKAVDKQRFERAGSQFKSFLDEATGFYHNLVAKLGPKHGLSGKLASPSNRIEISSSNERFKRSQLVCHRCYIYLGDLARYKERHLVVEGNAADYYVAAKYYRQASALWPAGGNPHSQLGVLASYAGDHLQALYRYLFSLSVRAPFDTARDNAKQIFEQNQRDNSQLSNSPEEDLAIDIQVAQPFESYKSSIESHQECPITRLQRRFRVHFITIIRQFFNKSGLEELPELSTSVLREAHLLLSQDSMLITSAFIFEKSNPFGNQALSVIQLVVLLIFSIHNFGDKMEKRIHNSDGPQMTPFVMQAVNFSFQFMTVLLQHCTRTEEPCCSHLFPAVVLFCNWLSSYPDFCLQMQKNEECDKSQCSFRKEAFLLLSKCIERAGMAKNRNCDSVANSDKEGHFGTETALWEDAELYGIVHLKCLETSETAVRLPVLAKGAQAESACVMRVERLMKALMLLSSVLKLDSSELDAIAAVSKSPFACASLRASPSEPIKCSESSGGSVRTAGGSMELRTQGPCIVQRSVKISLASHSRTEDCSFLPSRDQNLESAGPPNVTNLLSEGFHQHKTISEGRLKVCNVSEGTALQQPESELCGNNLETIVEDPVRKNLEHKDDGSSSSLSRGALSLGEWVKTPVGGDDIVDASSVLKMRTKPRQGASQQAQTHLSCEESLDPSLSFKAFCGTAKPPLFPSREDTKDDDTREKDQPIGLSGVCKESDTRTSLSLNRQPSAQHPVDLDREETTHNTEKDATMVEERLDSSKSRKRRRLPHEPSKGSSPESSKGYEAADQIEEGSKKRKGDDVDVEPGKQNTSTTSMEAVPAVAHVTNAQERRRLPHEPSKGSSPESSKGHEAVDQIEEGSKKRKGDDVDVEPGKQNTSTTSMEAVPAVAHVTSAQELNTSPHVMVGPSVQSLPDDEVASSQRNRVIVDGTDRQDTAILNNEKIGSSVGTPKIGLENCTPVTGRGEKNKHKAVAPQARTPLRCANSQRGQATSPEEGTSETLNKGFSTSPQRRKHHNVKNADFNRKQRSRHRKEPNPCTSLGSDRRTCRPSKRSRSKESYSEQDYSWLDAFACDGPQVLRELFNAIGKANSKFSSTGIRLEVVAKLKLPDFSSVSERTTVTNEHHFYSNF